MPVWLIPILGKAAQFIGQRFIHFMVYALIALLTIGIPYKLFVKDTNSSRVVVQKGAIYKADTCKKQVFFGCSMAQLKTGITWEKL